MKHNTYVCQKCGGKIVTINDDCGTTPFMLRCRATKNCLGTMQSNFGRVFPGAIATHEWYIRTDPEKMTLDELEHHSKGGAFIRRLPDGLIHRIGTRPKL